MLLCIVIVFNFFIYVYIFSMSGMLGGALFGNTSEYMRNSVEGGGILADLYPNTGFANAMNPKNWTVHNLATVLMIVGIVCLIIYTFLPGTSTGWAYTAGVCTFLYLIIDGMSVADKTRGLVTTSYNGAGAALLSTVV